MPVKYYITADHNFIYFVDNAFVVRSSFTSLSPLIMQLKVRTFKRKYADNHYKPHTKSIQ